VYTALGHGAENGTWRNFYLTGAQELRESTVSQPVDMTNPEMAMALTVGMLIDSLAVTLDGPRAWHDALTIDLVLTDERQRYRLILSNGALIHRRTPADQAPREPAGLTLTLDKPRLLGVLAGGGPDGVETQGDPALLGRLLSYATRPDPAFPIVTP
jgi:alkyl sulfatase BDS1-like metallo-beta-lactamase superfamily hydrolase